MRFPNYVDLPAAWFEIGAALSKSYALEDVTS